MICTTSTPINNATHANESRAHFSIKLIEPEVRRAGGGELAIGFLLGRQPDLWCGYYPDEVSSRIPRSLTAGSRLYTGWTNIAVVMENPHCTRDLIGISRALLQYTGRDDTVEMTDRIAHVDKAEYSATLLMKKDWQSASDPRRKTHKMEPPKYIVRLEILRSGDVTLTILTRAVDHIKTFQLVYIGGFRLQRLYQNFFRLW
ncbi:hypothetical protein BJ875DRAFT_543844 [Amylocarpus encephaloides]|uniref:Uncharacterized protein n=1 Tax=Amylocarpus encephaloides TaxID=45428 RepID=A0A9P7YGI4_9HELO|nr:hypothetical protein BJ875DRAFT_543844 [Amylocarpus encephaloides]